MVSTLTLDATINCFDQANEFVRSCAENAECSKKDVHSLLLVTEEIFVNIVNHAYGNQAPGTIELICNTDCDGVISLQFIDQGKPFDPLRIPPPDIRAPVEQRKQGGLGIFLIRSLVDSIRYDRCDNHNILTITKQKS